MQDSKQDDSHLKTLLQNNVSYESSDKATVVEKIFYYANISPNSIAYCIDDKEISYSELKRRILNIYHYFINKELSKGDVICLKGKPDINFIPIYYAIHLLNGVAALLEKGSTPVQIKSIADDLNAKLIICNEPLVNSCSFAEIENIANTNLSYDEPKSFPLMDTPCDIILTSGTTGKPKFVTLTHKNYSYYTYSFAKCFQIHSNSSLLCSTPLSHGASLWYIHVSLFYGQKFVYIEGMSDLKKYFDYIRKYHVTSMSCTPLIIHRLITLCGDALKSVKDQLDFIFFGTDKMIIDDIILLRKMMPDVRLYNQYALSECPAVSYKLCDSDNIQCNCVGKPFENVEVMIYKDGQFTNQPGTIGNIAIKSPIVMLKYYSNEELTKSVFVDDFLITSDLGCFNESGEILHHGRADDIIIISGQKISPQEVEISCFKSNLVDDCLLSVNKNNELILYIVPNNKYTNSQELVTFLKENLEPFKIPNVISTVKEIKRNKNGKPDRSFYKEKNID